YKTMDLPYMESVLWAFRQLWDKGLIYEGYRVLPYCWECETPLSNFETRQDDAYRPREDPAVTVAFELDGEPLRVLVWTTTPWALRVLAGDFVSTEEGTGIVHTAPGFGEDDQRLGEANGIQVVAPVDDRGRFTAEVPPYAGLQVLDANEAVIEDLAASGALL